MASTQYRGLTVFISDIRNCKTKEQEQLRVNRELANIRTKFTSRNGTNTSYKRKKYVWKMVYMFMLGHEIDFGHMEVIALIQSQKFSEKVVGYMAIATMLHHSAEMMTMIISSIKAELQGMNAYAKCLALSTVGNLGSEDFLQLEKHVQRLLTNTSSSPNVLKNAALCLLRIYRIHPESMDTMEWLPKLAQILEHRHYGVVISVSALMMAMVSNLNADSHDIDAAHECVVPRCCEVLYRLSVMRSVPDEYKYYGTPTPWLQIKLLKILQYFDPPTTPASVQHLRDVLTKVLTKTEVTKSVNKNNADHAVLFEAVNLIIHHDSDVADSMRDKAVGLLGRFISVREPNIRYLGLDTMSRLAKIESTTELIKRHQSTILYSLKDADISIRKRALDLLFSMCDETNSSEIVRELLDYLLVAEFGIKEEMVLKIAILAERYAPDYQWYVNTILKLITTAGDFVSDDIWHRAMQIISQHEPLQRYSAGKLHEALLVEGAVHQIAVKAAAYVLGEYGVLLSDPPEDSSVGLEAVPLQDQFDALSAHFEDVDHRSQALCLTAFLKMAHECADLMPQAREIMDSCRTSIDVELQNRACEYFALPQVGSSTIMASVLEPMPAFSSDRESILDRRLQARNEEGADTDVFTAKENQGDRESFSSGEEDDDDDVRPRATTGDLMGLDDDDGDYSSDEEREVPKELKHTMSHSALAGMFGESSTAQPETPDFDDDDLFDGEMLNEEDDEDDDDDEARAAVMHRDIIVSGSGGTILETSDIEFVIAPPQFRLSQGRIKILIKDKSGQGVSQLSITFEQTAMMRTAIQGLGDSVPAGGKVKGLLCVQAMGPFTAPPSFDVKYRSNASGSIITRTVRCPCFVGSFVTPVPLNGETFKKRWMGLVGEREAVAILDAPNGDIDMRELTRYVTDRLHCAIVPGIDKSPNVFECSWNFPDR
jgi:AP-2 complex subunit alpha